MGAAISRVVDMLKICWSIGSPVKFTAKYVLDWFMAIGHIYYTTLAFLAPSIFCDGAVSDDPSLNPDPVNASLCFFPDEVPGSTDSAPASLIQPRYINTWFLLSMFR